MAHVLTVNLGVAADNPHKADPVRTGIDKRPHDGAVEVRAPGPKGSGGGLVGDVIGDGRHHGGDRQAVYAFEREDLDEWERRLERSLRNGFFGENLTTRALDVNGARLGEIWQVGDQLRLRVESPRIPCQTFRGWVGEPGWLKLFTAHARPGAYLSVVEPGPVAAGDEVRVVERPDHDITVSFVFRALTTERDLLPRVLEAGDAIDPELLESARRAADRQHRRVLQ